MTTPEDLGAEHLDPELDTLTPGSLAEALYEYFLEVDPDMSDAEDIAEVVQLIREAGWKPTRGGAA
jgi:hypothetical protein